MSLFLHYSRRRRRLLSAAVAGTRRTQTSPKNNRRADVETWIKTVPETENALTSTTAVNGTPPPKNVTACETRTRTKTKEEAKTRRGTGRETKKRRETGTLTETEKETGKNEETETNSRTKRGGRGRKLERVAVPRYVA